MKYLEKLNKLVELVLSELTGENHTLLTANNGKYDENELEKLPYFMEQVYDYQSCFYIVEIKEDRTVIGVSEWGEQAKTCLESLEERELFLLVDYLKK